MGFLTNVFQTQKEAEQLTTGSDQAKDTSTHTFPTDSFVHTYQHLQMHKHTYVSMYMYLCMLYDLHKSTLTQFAPAEKLLVNITLTAILSPPPPHSKKRENEGGNPNYINQFWTKTNTQRCRNAFSFHNHR